MCRDSNFSKTHFIDSHTDFEVQDISLNPFPVPHDAREPCQFVFTDGAVRLAMVTDLGCSTPHIIEHLDKLDGLMLESWRPVAFDAEFATPVDDKSRHRISQKAVDNISNIGGGGVGGALSRSFLQFLEDFPYARLGIRCRLENGVCDMGGVEPAENGYYLVKGRFLPPRLDVVGFADRVNWDSLVAQIIAVTRDKNVIVE